MNEKVVYLKNYKVVLLLSVVNLGAVRLTALGTLNGDEEGEADGKDEEEEEEIGKLLLLLFSWDSVSLPGRGELR